MTYTSPTPAIEASVCSLLLNHNTMVLQESPAARYPGPITMPVRVNITKQQQWEESLMLNLRAEIARMDAAASTAAAAIEADKYVVIDDLTYVKAQDTSAKSE